DAVFGEMRRRADPRQHQKLGRIDRSAAQQRLARIGAVLLTTPDIANAPHPPVLDDQAADRRTIEQVEVGTAPRGPEEGVGRRIAPPLADRELVMLGALLLRAV